MKLDKESRILTAFKTSFERYMFNRFPIGVKMAKMNSNESCSRTFEISRMIYPSIKDGENILDTIVFGFKEKGSDHD